MEQILDLLGFECLHRRGDQWYGHCPIHEATARRRRREFSVNVALNCYYCHKCRSNGDQLALWAAATRRALYPSAIELCQRLGREVPWIHRW